MTRPILLAIVAIATACISNVEYAEACESSLAIIEKDYPTANFASCRILGEAEFELTIEPEDEPINPSPWYGFSVNRKDNSSPISVKLIYVSAPHRYIPKYSLDKVNWELIDDNLITSDESNNIIIEIPGESEGKIFISAQKIIDQEYYDRWITSLTNKYPSLQREIIGYSIAKRPIEALMVNSNADRVVLLLGRQHPPEVSGTEAFMAFAETLLSQKNGVSESEDSIQTAFFRSHMLVMIPLINPDGVQAGYWRHNFGSKDLNRDWFDGSEPEVRSVLEYVKRLESEGKEIVIHLDFHSTRRDVMYVQMPDDVTVPANFATKWFDAAGELGLEELPEFAPRPLTDQGTTKGYFFKVYGIPSITYEVGDETKAEDLRNTANHFARALIQEYGKEVAPRRLEQAPPCKTLYCFMVDANSASLIMLDEQGLIDSDLASELAQLQIEFQKKSIEQGWPAGQNYLDLEAEYIANIGTDASNVHIGRSRQDLHGVSRRMLARHLLLEHFDRLISLREVVLRHAKKHANIVIPAYTHGVPSQPTTYGHKLLAFEAAFSRDTDRLKDAFTRMNRSQLGVAAGSGSGFELDRRRAALLLGFEGEVENTFDGNFLSTADYKLEIASAIAQSVATITKFTEDLHAQQRNPHPWLYLAEELTSGSSIMPQKRNPREIDKVRRLAAKVLAASVEVMLLNHNVDTGMHDYRDLNPIVDMLSDAGSLFRGFERMIEHVIVDERLAIEELNRGYSTSTEVADTLTREAGISFRDAHEVAKRLTNLARSESRPLTALTSREIKSIYQDVLESRLPIEVSRLKEAMSPEGFINLRNMPGGPARDAVVDAHHRRIAVLSEDRTWLQSQNEHLREREYWLNHHLGEIAGRASSTEQ